MPLREYRCEKGHTFEALVKHDGSDEPTKCDAPFTVFVPATGAEATTPCGAPLSRVMSVNAKSFPGADSWRR